MGTEETKVGVSVSESVSSGFKRHIKWKNKIRSSMPSPFSNYAVQIHGSRESKALVRIVSIFRLAGELIPVILSPVGKAISIERPLTKKKEALGFDASEIKVKSRAAEIPMKSCEPEICTEELPSKQISEEEDEFAVKMSWVRVSKAFRFPKAPDFRRNGPKVSQDLIRRSHAKDNKAPMIEQHKTQAIGKKKGVADSIPGPIDQASKPSRTSTAVYSKSGKLWKFINSQRKVSSDASKRQGIKSATLSQLQRPDMNSVTPNSQPKKPNMSAERKGSITGDATGEGEDYRMAINLSVLIIIMACLILFSSRLLAVLCTSIWWYLLPSPLSKSSVSAAAPGVKSGRSNVKHEKKKIEGDSLRFQRCH